ncbi:hypothetical protein H6771_00780 [Candidatus Peribacteria bacterium]|nr:hypothetical protein [Candidatus Peribacteria bacterium]
MNTFITRTYRLGLLSLCLLSGSVLAQVSPENSFPGEDKGTPGYSLDEGLSRILPEGASNIRPAYLVGAGKVARPMRADVAEITNQIQKLTNGLTLGAATIAVVFIVFYGVQIALGSGGNDTEAQKHLQKLLLAVAGLVLIIFAYIIVRTIVAITYSGEGLQGEINQGNFNAPLQDAELQ